MGQTSISLWFSHDFPIVLWLFPISDGFPIVFRMVKRLFSYGSTFNFHQPPVFVVQDWEQKLRDSTEQLSVLERERKDLQDQVQKAGFAAPRLGGGMINHGKL